MTFHSIAFHDPIDLTAVLDSARPTFFTDLNLDQFVDAVTGSRQEYDLKPFFYTTLTSVEAIEYRHEVMHDLESEGLFECVSMFGRQMQSMRGQLGQAAKLREPYQRESWFLDAVLTYCGAVAALAQGMSLLDPGSRGFRKFREYLLDYAGSGAFAALVADADDVKAQLASVAYCLQIFEGRIRVSRYDGETDYSAEVTATFERFKQGAEKDYRVGFSSWPALNHVEEGVLRLVAQLHPTVFAALDDFAARRQGYADDTIATFDREVQFYLAYLEFMARLRRAGLSFCYPKVSAQSKEVAARETFDVALANKLVSEQTPVVCNDFFLQDPERILVVSGPNQGGKTTFARTFGQLHYLARLGCPVPGSHAELFRYDQVFTHFERGENLRDLSGKLQDELLRIRDIVDQATPNSVVIMNEIFTSTTPQDAVRLGTAILERLIELDCLCVCVTFVDELATLAASTISMVSTVVPENPATRTFKICRQPPAGLSYAYTIADSHGLTYHRLRARLAS